MNWDQVSKELSKPLDTRVIKPAPQGKFGEYVDGLHVIQEANRIFGFDGWSYRVTRLEQASCEVFTLNGKQGEYQQVRVSYMCSVLVVVNGEVNREGCAVGVGNGRPENIGDVIESAVKEAETDALKRALRTFGNTFGLALYEKDKGARQVIDFARVADAVGAMQAAMSGKALLAACKEFDDVGSDVSVTEARVEALRSIVKGAVAQAMPLLEQNFAPDWQAVEADAAARLDEITQKDAA